MSNFDTAFIKAYGKNEPRRPRGDSQRREEPIVDQIPNGGQAPTLNELCEIGAVTSTRKANASSGPKPVSTTRRPVENAAPAEPSAPRLATHTIVEDDDDELYEQPKRVRTAPLSAFRQAELRRARLRLQRDADALDESDFSSEPEIETHNEPEPVAATAVAPIADPPMAPVWPPEPLRPQAAFQVERFFWPAICETLTENSRQSFDTLCEQLIAGSRKDRKLLAVAGSRAQAGATTLVLSLAKQLSSSGVRVAIVDADLEHPELAHQLSVVPQYAWHDVALQGLPLGECWVESTSEQVTLAALVKPLRKLDPHLAAALREQMDQTREAFDLTLVDIGQLNHAIDSGMLANLRPDGVVYVKDLRQRGGATLADLEHAFRSQGIAWWGIAENFTE